MSMPPDLFEEISALRPRRRHRRGFSLRLTRGGVAAIAALNFAVLALISRPAVETRLLAAPPEPSLTVEMVISPSLEPSPTITPAPDTPTPSTTPTSSQTPTATFQPPYPSSQGEDDPVLGSSEGDEHPQDGDFLGQDLIILALDEGLHTRLFAYHPQKLPLTRITAGPWSDMHPRLSPDGQKIAFTSNRNGYWDLYTLDLLTGSLARLTDTLAYEGSPSWSPDGRWIVYESYDPQEEGGLELYILAVGGGQEPIRLTEHPAADHSPAWSPTGRMIAYISNRSGEPDVWLADLDHVGEDRFRNVSSSAVSQEGHPAWSPDGERLAWVSRQDGFHSLYVLQNTAGDTGERAVYAGSGSRPAWSPDGRTILTVLEEANQSHLTAFYPDQPGLVLPPLALPGRVSGLTWGQPSASLALPAPFSHIASLTPTPVWLPVLSANNPEIPYGRHNIVPLQDVTAPSPLLHDLVDESFTSLRESVAREAGWDFLSSLENAYVPITSVLNPGMGSDWLYTGRAFAFNTLPFHAGWLVVIREDYYPNTYWRVYLRARFQDGSAGLPLVDPPWDFTSRYTGSTTAYEQGGSLSSAIPPGYWIDFTQTAARYGWERLPALSTWRSAFSSVRYNIFANTSQLDWASAMLELYPPEALVTPTAVVPPTRTPTPTSRWYQSPTPTTTSTPRPTLTPPAPALLENPNQIPAPSATPKPQ